MRITRDFLTFICKDYQEDFAFDVYDNYFSNQEVPYDVFMNKLDELIELDQNRNKWTILDRLPYMPDAIMFNKDTFEYTNNFFTIDNMKFTTLEDAKVHAKNQASSIDPVQLCVVTIAEKLDKGWKHKDKISNLQELSSSPLLENPEQWFSLFKPSETETIYVQGREQVLNIINSEHEIECRKRLIYKIYQQVRDIEHGFTADIEIVDGPY